MLLLVLAIGQAAYDAGANGSSAQEPQTTAVPAAPVDRAGEDARRDVDLDKALADLLTNAANIGMPEISEARVKALLAQAKVDDKMKALLKAQFDAALGKALGRWVEFMNGRGTLNFLLASLEQPLEAETDLCDQKADHVAALGHHLNRVRKIEKVSEQRFRQGQWTIQDVLECRFYRLQAEIRLERARHDLAKQSSAQEPLTTAVPAAPVDRAGGDARRDVDLDKALADLLTNAANIGMPEISEARVKAPLAQAKVDDKMKALLKAQFDAALGKALGRWVEFMNGRGTLNFLLASLEDLLDAERDLSDHKTDHVAALEHHLKRVREIEKLNDQRGRQGRVAIQNVLEPRFYRLQAEIRLERARRDLAKQGP
jgi:hypothetical protein